MKLFIKVPFSCQNNIQHAFCYLYICMVKKWIGSQVVEVTSNKFSLNCSSMDLSPDTLEFLTHLMCAQARECLFEKNELGLYADQVSVTLIIFTRHYSSNKLDSFTNVQIIIMLF
jgi:hypothetical protein